MPYDVGIWDAATGGTRYTPPQLEFATPTAAEQIQIQSVYVGNVGTDTVPAGAFLMMTDPYEVPAGVTNEARWRRNQSRNVQRGVSFSTDGGVTWHSRAWFSALVPNAARIEVQVRWGAPAVGDDYRRGPEIGKYYAYPIPGMPDDWPPVVGLEVAIGCRPFLLESFEHWQHSVTSDNWVIAAKWDFFYSPTLGGQVIDPTGGPRGGPCWLAQQGTGPNDGLEVYGTRSQSNRQEILNIDEGDGILYAGGVGSRVCMGQDGQFTEEGIPLMAVEVGWTGSGNLPVVFAMGADGDLTCRTWDVMTGAVIQHTVPCTWGPDDYKYLEVMAKVLPDVPDEYQAGFYVDGVCVWSGTIGVAFGSVYGIEKLRLGPLGQVFPLNHLEPWYIRLRYADAYLGEPAGPINQCNLRPIEVWNQQPNADGTYQGWTDRYPTTPVNALYTYVDEPDWDEGAGTWIAAPASTPDVNGDYPWNEPRVTFPQGTNWGTTEILVVQPYAIGGAWPVGQPDDSLNALDGTYEWSAYIKVGTDELAVNPNPSSGGPWQIDYRTLPRNPWTALPWLTSDVQSMEFGAAMTCELDPDYDTHTEQFALTQTGLEVAVRSIVSVTVTWSWGTIIG